MKTTSAMTMIATALMLTACVEECPPGTAMRWTPEPPREEVVACAATPGGRLYFCMQDLGYRRACR
jgi:hypothetical protein